jgi:hypothetical protein
MARLSFISALVCMAAIGAPTRVSAQTGGPGITIEGAVGTPLSTGGHDASIALGLQLGERLTLLGGAERLYWPTQRNGAGYTRGGTVSFANAALRVTLAPPLRAAPYAIVGLGRGVSRPNVNDIFPTPVRNDATVLFFGGGVRIAAAEHLSVIADVRAGLLAESDSLAIVLPARVGLSWQF